MSKQSKTRGINHILNYNRKENALKPELANVYYDTDNKGNNVQVACDGFRLAVLKDFAEVKNIEMENAKNIPYINWETYFDIDAVVSDGNIVELPDLKVLKEYVKAYKKITNSRPVYDFGENQPYVNMNYLVDAMEIVDLKTAKAYASGYKNLSLLLIDEAGNYVYTMGILGNKRREKTDLSISNIK